MFLKMKYSFFTTMRMVTARNRMIVIRNAHAFPSCSNQLMVANQNAHVSSELHDRQEEDVRVAGRCHDQDDACIFCFLDSSALFSLAIHFSFVINR